MRTAQLAISEPLKNQSKVEIIRRGSYKNDRIAVEMAEKPFGEMSSESQDNHPFVSSLMPWQFE